jgi:ring-1,2-phenylacetyl-CoA epoxidase subunit PaaD
MTKKINKDFIFEILAQIPDPEIPVLSITDLGVVRAVDIKENEIQINITPTYSGCPAMKLIEEQIIELLSEKTGKTITVNTVYAPAWTTDWIPAEAKIKLREYGIAPPEKSSPDKSFLFADKKKINCPRCHSENTEMISQFGSTACKALYKCLDCLEPFDYFKCI